MRSAYGLYISPSVSIFFNSYVGYVLVAVHRLKMHGSSTMHILLKIISSDVMQSLCHKIIM